MTRLVHLGDAVLVFLSSSSMSFHKDEWVDDLDESDISTEYLSEAEMKIRCMKRSDIGDEGSRLISLRNVMRVSIFRSLSANNF